MKKKLLIPSVIVIIFMLIYIIYISHTLNNYKKDLKQLNNINNQLTENIKKSEYNIEKLKGSIGMYNDGIDYLYKELGTVYKCKEIDKNYLANANKYIVKNNLFDDDLIFQLEIRPESKNVYFIDCIGLRKENVKTAFEDLNNFFPSERLAYHILKCTVLNNSIKYEVIE